MNRLLVLASIITFFLCSCTKIHLYPVFENEDNIVFLVKNLDSINFSDSLQSIAYSYNDTAYSLRNTADSLLNVSDSLRHTADSLSNIPDSLRHISDSLRYTADSLKALYEYYYDYACDYLDYDMDAVSVLPSDTCTIFVPFMYARETKSAFNIYDCHEFTGRAKCGETVLNEQTYERDKFFSHSDILDSLERPYTPFPYSLLLRRPPYCIGFKIPENDSPSSRTISFEYSYQEKRLFNKWSDWIYISSIEQKGRAGDN